MNRKVSVCSVVSIAVAVLSPLFVTPLLAADEGNAERGKAVFQQCSICHQVGPNAANGIGPNLTGVFDRKMGSADGFAYGTGLKKASEAGLKWDHEMVFGWLANPKAYIQGVLKDDTVTTKMTVKISDEQSRRDVIAYIATFSNK